MSDDSNISAGIAPRLHRPGVLAERIGTKAPAEIFTGTPERPGTKYDRVIKPKYKGQSPITVDVYSVLDSFGVRSHAVAHAIKKLLVAGKRGKGDAKQDLTEAIDAIQREVDELGGGA